MERPFKLARPTGDALVLVSEMDQLREAYRSLNDITRNLVSAQKCLKKEDLRMAEHHLRAAEWHAAQAKQTIAAVGQAKPQQ